MIDILVRLWAVSTTKHELVQQPSDHGLVFSRDEYAALFVQSAVTPHTGRTADGYALTSGGDYLVREGVGEAGRVRREASSNAGG